MTESVIQDKRYNPYFLAFMRVKGLNIGDEFNGYEYINWIQDKHRQFRKEYNLPKEKEWIGYTPLEQKLFEKWLDEISVVEVCDNWVKNGCKKTSKQESEDEG